MLSFAILPLCAHLLGMDAFGLLGIAATFQLIVFILDGGNIIARLMAKHFDATNDIINQRAYSLFAAAERHYLGLLLLGATICLALAWPLSILLVASSSLPPPIIGQSLALIGIGAFIKLLTSYYRGCLVGLHMQVRANLIGLGANIVRFPLAYLFGLLIPDIRVFLATQLASFVLEAWLLRSACRVRLAREVPAQIGPGLASLRRERQFITSTMGLAALSTIAGQVDKVMLASALSLAEFGAASLAILMCGGLFVLATPVLQIYLPRLAAKADVDGVRSRQTASALMATLLCVSLPAAVTLALCAPAIARLVAPSQAGSVALIGDAFVLWGLGNCLSIAALGLYLLYFAAGWVIRYATLLAAYLALYLPLSWMALHWRGLHGAGSAWVLGNLLLLALLMIDLARRNAIDATVVKMLAVSMACMGIAWGLGGIIHPLLPLGAIASAGVTAVTYLTGLALTALILLPTLRRTGSD